MIKEKRLQKIKDYILKHQSASLDELMSVFHVSKNTIRRDVQELVESGEFQKVYGGVKTKKQKQLESFQTRKIQNQSEKTAIGLTAASYVQDGDVIFIDSGTTTFGMFDYLQEKTITVVTNNMEFVIRSMPFDNLTVIVIGGVLERKTNSLGQPQSTDFLQMYNITKAFMASTGVSLSYGITNSSPLETELKQTVVARSEKVFLVIDHHKIGKSGLTTYGQLHDIDYLITDKLPPIEYQDYLNAHNIEVVCAEC